MNKEQKIIVWFVVIVVLVSAAFLLSKFFGVDGDGEISSPTDVSVVVARLGEEVSALGVSITPIAVVEDSRCPLDVQCIQAGTIRLRTNFKSGLGTGEQIFKLGETIMTEEEEVVLTEVSPAPNSKVTIDPEDYRFTFRVAKRTAVSVSVVPTTFAKLGTVTWDNPGQKKDTLYLVYEEPGKPALSKELRSDIESTCVVPEGSALCLAISAPLSYVYDGKRVSVEGIDMDGYVLVRLIRLLEEDSGRPQRELKTGELIVSWPTAVQLIESCSINFAGQAHSLDVNLDLKDGRKIRTVEPVIDELFQVIDNNRSACGDIPVATE